MAQDQAPMSTDISDLPGPPEEIEEIEEIKQPTMHHQPMHREFMHQPIHQRHHQIKEEFESPESNVTIDIKKKPYMDGAIIKSLNINSIDSPVNLSDLLLLAVVYFATMQNSNDYTRKILEMITRNRGYSHISVTIIKCILLVVLYKIIVTYLMPYILNALK
jgi:hypothetical protein